MTLCSSLESAAGTWPSRISLVPSTLKMSAEWCATKARPDSVTMSGWGTPLAVQASLISETMSRAYSASE